MSFVTYWSHKVSYKFRKRDRETRLDKDMALGSLCSASCDAASDYKVIRTSSRVNFDSCSSRSKSRSRLNNHGKRGARGSFDRKNESGSSGSRRLRRSNTVKETSTDTRQERHQSFFSVNGKWAKSVARSIVNLYYGNASNGARRSDQATPDARAANWVRGISNEAYDVHKSSGFHTRPRNDQTSSRDNKTTRCK